MQACPTSEPKCRQMGSGRFRAQQQTWHSLSCSSSAEKRPLHCLEKRNSGLADMSTVIRQANSTDRDDYEAFFTEVQIINTPGASPGAQWLKFCELCFSGPCLWVWIDPVAIYEVAPTLSLSLSRLLCLNKHLYSLVLCTHALCIVCVFTSLLPGLLGSFSSAGHSRPLLVCLPAQPKPSLRLPPAPLRGGSSPLMPWIQSPPYFTFSSRNYSTSYCLCCCLEEPIYKTYTGGRTSSVKSRDRTIIPHPFSSRDAHSH